MGIYALLLVLHITSKYEEKYEPNPQAVLLLFTASALSGAVTFIKIQLLIWECQNTILFALQILHHPAGFLGYVFVPNSFYLFTFFFISWYKAIYVSPFFIDKVKKNELVPWMHFTWYFFRDVFLLHQIFLCISAANSHILPNMNIQLLTHKRYYLMAHFVIFSMHKRKWDHWNTGYM